VVALVGPGRRLDRSHHHEAIMGLLARGPCAFQCVDISRGKPHEIARLGSASPRNRRFSPLTVMENLDVGVSRRLRLTATPAGVEPDEALQAVSQFGEMPDRPGGGLSGGEQQMLTVGGHDGKSALVLADDPRRRSPR